MVEEVAIDRNLCVVDRKRSDTKPVGIDVAGRFAPVTLAKKHDVGHHGGSFSFEGDRRAGGSPRRNRLFGPDIRGGRHFACRACNAT